MRNVKLSSIILILMSVLSLIFTATVLSGGSVPYINNKINLGLDLQGGSSLLFKADFDSFIAESLQGSVADINSDMKGVYGVDVAKITDSQIMLPLSASADMHGVDKTLKKFEEMFQVIHTDGEVTLKIRPEYMIFLKKQLVTDAIRNIRNRIDALGVKEVSVQAHGSDFILVEVPGAKDPAEVKSIIGRTAKLTFHLLADPHDLLSKARSVKTRGTDGGEYMVSKNVALAGDMLHTASASYNSQTGKPVVMFSFNNVGARKFADLTQHNVGRQLAIVLDGFVVAAPMIREPIMGGRGEISGNFSLQQVNELAIVLRSGALPVPLVIAEERTIGPTLGADSIVMGKRAVIYAFILVALFMTIVYSYLGLIASLSMVITVSNIISAICLIGTTLTLPGLAGIVLTIGMVVDANVLIFEKIREEVLVIGGSALGSLSKSFGVVERGFDKALSAIVDSNVTTLIAGLTLFFIGDGPLKGFAMTLCIGILSSFLTSVMLSRLMVLGLVRVKHSALAQIC